ncbi:hypothetical protein [Paenibacillus glufosinatiresistens]|uniref:hypothetical protein n=1 Tax=Paenibacillus glufosinatiresistens TaxID=3070657 RepID=UPI00286D919E|nr:hypothetical protein [Paenibacillus sp. YX.27]
MAAITKGILAAAGLSAILLLAACSDSNGNTSRTIPSAAPLASAPNAAAAQESRTEWMTETISRFTGVSFRFVETFKLESGEEGYALRLSFIPEAGSAPIKEDIYRSIAEYAWSIQRFFPEIQRYEFHVLWDENSKKEAIGATIGGEAVQKLAERYSGIKADQQAGLGTSWRSVFSDITESAEAKGWHEKDSGV